jgi:hypothetical protein
LTECILEFDLPLGVLWAHSEREGLLLSHIFGLPGVDFVPQLSVPRLIVGHHQHLSVSEELAELIRLVSIDAEHCLVSVSQQTLDT